MACSTFFLISFFVINFVCSSLIIRALVISSSKNSLASNYLKKENLVGLSKGLPSYIESNEDRDNYTSIILFTFLVRLYVSYTYPSGGISIVLNQLFVISYNFLDWTNGD